MEFGLTVVLPLRLESYIKSDFMYICDLLKFLKNEGNIRTIVVDDGSPKSIGAEISLMCDENACDYTYIDSNLEDFCLARAYNIGVGLAQTQHVVLFRLSSLLYSNTFQRIIGYIESFEMKKRSYRFISLPTIKVTKVEYEGLIKSSFKERDLSLRRIKWDRENSSEKGKLDFFEANDSVLVVDKYHYLSIGGMDESVPFGIGNVILQATLNEISNEVPKPDGYSIENVLKASPEAESSLGEYLGVNTKLMYFCDMLAYEREDSIVEHCPKTLSDELPKSNFLSNHMVYGRLPPVRGNLNKEKVLIITDECGGFYECIRQILPYLGRPVAVPENFFSSLESLRDYLIREGISIVILHNPYSNADRYKKYLACKEIADTRIFERGALPESWYLDSCFANDSDRYRPDYWDSDLEHEDLLCVENYIRSLRNGSSTLEVNSERIFDANTKAKLEIDNGMKVLFVPLQNPSDTVVKNYAFENRGYEDFLSVIECLGHALENMGWLLVIKEHPLLRKFDTDVFGRVAPEDMNVHDLISISDAVLTYNSGVGILALAHGKPTATYAPSFYGSTGLVRQVFKDAEVFDFLSTLQRPDMGKVKSFFSYLLKDVYSFGKSVSVFTKKTSGEVVRATVGIDYYRISIDGAKIERTVDREVLSVNSFLLDAYTSKGRGVHPSDTSITCKDYFGRYSCEKTIRKYGCLKGDVNYILRNGFSVVEECRVKGREGKGAWATASTSVFVIDRGNWEYEDCVYIKLSSLSQADEIEFSQLGVECKCNISIVDSKSLVAKVTLSGFKENVPIIVRTLLFRKPTVSSDKRIFYWWLFDYNSYKAQGAETHRLCLN